MKLKFPLNTMLILVMILFYKNLHAQTEDLGSSPSIKTIKSIHSLKQACVQLNRKLLTNSDLVYYFKDCSLHLVSDTQLLNTLIQSQHKEPFPMSPEVYALLPLGKKYTYEDYYKDYSPKRAEFSISTCQKFNNHIVSVDNYSYYYIEGCKKRKFDDYAAMQNFNSTLNDSIYAISSFEFSRFPEGKPMVIHSKPENIKEISEAEVKKNLPNKSILCKHLNHKVTAFYQSFFYVEKCTLRPITDFNVALQMQAQEHGGILDLSLEQILGLTEGEEITSKEVMKRITR